LLKKKNVTTKLLIKILKIDVAHVQDVPQCWKGGLSERVLGTPAVSCASVFCHQLRCILADYQAYTSCNKYITAKLIYWNILIYI
jgi:hypothetical protein